MKQRELKFRIWNKHAKDWVLNTGEEQSLVSFGVFNCLINSFGNGANLHIQQYTGHKDRNGKDIYEGDIIQLLFGQDHSIKTGTFVIKYWEPTMQYVFDTTVEPRQYLQDHAAYNIAEKLARSDIEVIGNVFENRDLLK